MAAANHGEGFGAGEERGAGEFGYGFLAGVDEIGIGFAFERIRSDAEHAIFRLQNDFDAGGDEVRDQRGNADAEIDVEAVAQFAGDAAGNTFARIHYAVLFRTVRRSMRFSQVPRRTRWT